MKRSQIPNLKYSTLSETLTNAFSLMQASSSESLMLRTARRYDITLDAVIFSKNVMYSQKVWQMICRRY
jgi:hypothetical protein